LRLRPRLRYSGQSLGLFLLLVTFCLKLSFLQILVGMNVLLASISKLEVYTIKRSVLHYGREEMKMKKVFIFGYYGFKNIGDEAILSSIIKTLREINPSIDISALSYNVKYTEKIHNIKGVSRNDIREIIKAIKRCDLVISGGGSLLQDVTSNRSIIYYLGLILMSKFYEKPVVFFSNGFGPVNKEWNRYLVRKIVNKVDKIILRDNDSKQLMQKIGITKEIDVTIDATYALDDIATDELEKIIQEECIPGDKPLVGISVRPWVFSENFRDIMAEFADYIVEKGFEVLFIPMQVPKDSDLSKEIISKMKNKAYVLQKEYRPQEILSIVGKLEILIGMRLHSLIFASIQGVPMLGIEYDPKIDSFLKIADQKNLGKVEKLNLENLYKEFDRVVRQHMVESLKTQGIAELLKEKAEENKKLLLEMLR